MLRLQVGCVCAALALTMACGDDDADDDAPDLDAAIDIDSATPPVDAGAPDAAGLCPGGSLLVTGEYVDWDSTNTDFAGVAGATVTEVGNETNQVTTAPNGRFILCVDTVGDFDVLFTHDNYLTLRLATSSTDAAAQLSLRGLTPARAATVYTDDLGVARDDARATGIILWSGLQQPANLDADHASPVDLFDDAFTVFPNLDATAGTVDVVVTPSGGVTCQHRADIPVAAGELTATRVTCTD